LAESSKNERNCDHQKQNHYIEVLRCSINESIEKFVYQEANQAWKDESSQQPPDCIDGDNVAIGCYGVHNERDKIQNDKHNAGTKHAKHLDK
jgi:hypothetical protein